MIVIVIDAVIKKTEYNLTSHNLDVPFRILLLEDQLASDELLNAKKLVILGKTYWKVLWIIPHTKLSFVIIGIPSSAFGLRQIQLIL